MKLKDAKCKTCGRPVTKLMRSGKPFPHCFDCYKTTGRYQQKYNWENMSKAERERSGFCRECGITQDLCIDHYLCLDNGCALSVTNAVPLCKICNAAKGTKVPADFFTEQEISKIEAKFKEARKYV